MRHYTKCLKFFISFNHNCLVGLLSFSLCRWENQELQKVKWLAHVQIASNWKRYKLNLELSMPIDCKFCESKDSTLQCLVSVWTIWSINIFKWTLNNFKLHPLNCCDPLFLKSCKYIFVHSYFYAFFFYPVNSILNIHTVISVFPNTTPFSRYS